MKKQLVVIALILITTGAWAQESMFTLSYGWANLNPEESDKNAAGWRINGLYEFNPTEGKIAHGLNIGYVLTKYDQTTQAGTTNFSFRSWPVYYAPKVLLGNNDKFKPFLKGALGVHFSKYRSEGVALELEGSETGFYGGLGAGALLFLKETLFLNLEYEWAYQTNYYTGNGFLNTAQLGLGFKF
ncbi:MAG: outer membrane beta-barrel protein [Cyclobacteriaceae bacterium]|nr:outer membrane beta-barrel protein [Cyclobacteriaceae bacterium]